MNKFYYWFFPLIICLFFISCSGKKKNPGPDKASIDSNKITGVDSLLIDKTIMDSSQISISDPFYELEESINDIVRQVGELQAKVSEYENNLSGSSYAEKLKELIGKPLPNHKIGLKNGSIIEGTIEKDLEEYLLVLTEVGKLTIDKKEIEYIHGLSQPEPDIIFIGHGQKEIFDSYHLFTGKVLNQGDVRGDFVRVIFQLWDEHTQIISIDSAFVEGSQIKYKSGIVADTAVEPNKSALFSVKIPINNSTPISYITREIHWLKFE